MSALRAKPSSAALLVHPPPCSPASAATPGSGCGRRRLSRGFDASRPRRPTAGRRRSATLWVCRLRLRALACPDGGRTVRFRGRLACRPPAVSSRPGRHSVLSNRARRKRDASYWPDPDGSGAAAWSIPCAVMRSCSAGRRGWRPGCRSVAGRVRRNRGRARCDGRGVKQHGEQLDRRAAHAKLAHAAAVHRPLLGSAARLGDVPRDVSNGVRL